MTIIELDKFDENGMEYVYSVVEKEVKGYESEVTESDDGFIITNTYITDALAEGDHLPKTATNMYNFLLLGGLGTFFGLIVLLYARRREV